MGTWKIAKGQIPILAALRKKYGIIKSAKITILDPGDEIMLRAVMSSEYCSKNTKRQGKRKCLT